MSHIGFISFTLLFGFRLSDHLETKPQIKAAAAGESAKDTAAQEKDRLLKGVMRVGMLSKGLLLKDDTEVDFFRTYFEFLIYGNNAVLSLLLAQVHLVVLCSHIPGLSLLKEVATLIPKYYEVCIIAALV